VFDVHKTLNLFQKGTLSKKETHKTILDTLDGHDDLRQELMDILLHPAARWGLDDFDLPAQDPMQPLLETAPQYLQPPHELQMRLPSFSSWFPASQNDHLGSLPAFSSYNGYNGSGREQSFVSSPSLSIPPPLQLPDPSGHLWIDADAEASYTNLHGNEFLAPPVQTAFRNPWDNSNHYDTWTNDGMTFPTNNENLGGNFDFEELSTLPFHDHPQASLSHSHDTESYTTLTLPQQEAPRSLHTTQHTPSPTNHDPFRTMKLEENLADLHAPPTPSSQSPPHASQTEDVVEAVEAEQASMGDRSQSLGGPFVHAICGKGFATLSGVKKHHWGKKVNDLATTTGCWAKHKKPNVAWDEHASCKDGRSTSVVIKSHPPTTKQNQTKASTPQFTGVSAYEVPHFQPLPGFPTLEDLPRTVAKTIHTGNAPTSYSQEPEMTVQTPEPAIRGSFDSLLTAVNVVSQIDAPKPKGRADSIALNLDAQVAAAEQHHPFIPYEPSTSSLDSPSYRAIAPAALDMTCSFLMEGHPNNTSGHHTNYTSEEQASVPSSDMGGSYVVGALSRPFQPLVASSSGPAKKKRKV
jgi:hypothetical protein